MDDIVTQLQRTKFMQHADIETLCDQAAAEIKRLRAAGDVLMDAIRNHDLREQHIKGWEEARRG